MPFIRGRYHMNPVMGEALEAAREAEAALLARENRGQENNDKTTDGTDAENSSGGEPEADDGNGPIHRVEIEASEVVPAHSGRAACGFVAHVHRVSAAPSNDSGAQSTGSGFSLRETPAEKGSASVETHIFSDHRDLVNFLRNELPKDAGK